MHIKVPASAGATITITGPEGGVTHSVSKDHRVAVKTEQEAEALLSAIEGSTIAPEETK